MCSDVAKFPNNIRCLILLNVGQDVIVAHHFFKGIIIDRTQKFHAFRVLVEMVLMVFNCLHNPGMESLAIFLRVKEKSTVN